MHFLAGRENARFLTNQSLDFYEILHGYTLIRRQENCLLQNTRPARWVEFFSQPAGKCMKNSFSVD